jgi:hypothetical protein
MTEITREVIIEAAKEAQSKFKAPISKKDFERISGISEYHIYRLFPDGGWSEVKTLACLDRHPKHNRPVSDDLAMQEFNRVTSELGRIPSWAQFDARSSISADVIRSRFGGHKGILKQYRNWLEINEPESLLLIELKAYSLPENPTPPQRAPNNQRVFPIVDRKPKEGLTFGPPINFRGLRHAPINEQGVVFLFGMVSDELGFIVEAINAAFPD